jgi:hypothetical protein
MVETTAFSLGYEYHDNLFVLITYIRDVFQILTGEDVLRGGIILATIVSSASLRIIIPQATLRLRKMT